MLNSGHDQPLANTCVAAVAAVTLFVRVVLITQFVSLSSRFHVNTGYFCIYCNKYGLRLGWFSVICIYPKASKDGLSLDCFYASSVF